MSNLPKARVAARFRQAVAAKSNNESQRSNDLSTAEANINAFLKRLKQLVQALKNHHDLYVNEQKAKHQVIASIALLSENTPLFDIAGDMTSGTPSYAKTHSDLQAQKKSFSDKYVQFILNYSIEWEKTLNIRISQNLKEVKKLQLEFHHYHQKVTTMRTQANLQMAKGKLVDPKVTERLGRNEEKLNLSRNSYEQKKEEVCVLIDDVTKCCWKDLFPLLLKMAQFDLRGSMDQNSLIVQQMNPIIDRLNGFAKEQNVGVNSRLEQLKSLNAFELSGVAREQRALPGSDSFLSDSNHTYNSMGGYASSSGTGNSGGGLYEYENVASPSFNTSDTSLPAIETSASTQSSYSTFNMLQTASHAPPPPTLEQLENATQSLSLTHSGASTSSYNNYNTNSSNPFGSAFDAPLPPPPVQSTPSMPTHAPPPPPTPQSTTNGAMTPYGGAPTNQWQLGQPNSFHGTSTPSYDNTNGGMVPYQGQGGSQMQQYHQYGQSNSYNDFTSPASQNQPQQGQSKNPFDF